MYRLTKLSNGVRVLSVAMSNRSSVAIGAWARVGGRFESNRVNGVSHFLEHMLFKGTTHRSTRRIKSDIEGVGGVLNAFTSEESTCYFVKILRNHAEKAFDVLADMMNNALLDAKEHERERGVILEEIKMYRDLPSHHVQELLTELLWPDQPLGRPLAGTIESVSRLSPKDLHHHMETHYHSNNLLLTFCGGITHEAACNLAEKAFGHQKRRSNSHFSSAHSAQKKARFQFVNKKTEQMHLAIGFHGISKMHPDRYKLALLNIILGANMSSRLFEEVREKRGLAYEIRSGVTYFEDAGAVVISAGVEPKKELLAVRVIMKELKRLKSAPVTKDELRRAKDYFIGQFALGLEDTLDHMLWVGERTLYRDDLPNRDEIERSIEAVDAEEIRRLSRALLRSDGVNLALIGSTDEKLEKQMCDQCECGS